MCHNQSVIFVCARGVSDTPGRGIMKIGYIRVSKQEQNESLQRDALQEAGCEKYFSDKMTGSTWQRKGLEELLEFMRSGDTVIVWKLDRLGRSLKDLIETLNLLNNRGINFISLTESIDTTTPGGKLIFHLMGALAEFERDLIRDRTNAGLAAARARGLCWLHGISAGHIAS